jgi:hypothetical protein
MICGTATPALAVTLMRQDALRALLVLCVAGLVGALAAVKLPRCREVEPEQELIDSDDPSRVRV